MDRRCVQHDAGAPPSPQTNTLLQLSTLVPSTTLPGPEGRRLMPPSCAVHWPHHRIGRRGERVLVSPHRIPRNLSRAVSWPPPLLRIAAFARASARSWQPAIIPTPACGRRTSSSAHQCSWGAARGEDQIRPLCCSLFCCPACRVSSVATAAREIMGTARSVRCRREARHCTHDLERWRA